MNLLVGIPTANYQMYVTCVSSLLPLFVQCVLNEDRLDLMFDGGSSATGHARNKMAARCEEIKSEHLLFIDADVGQYTYDDVHAMVGLGLDVVCAAYPRKDDEGGLVYEPLEEEVSPETNPYVERISRCGAGLLLVNRRVFSRMRVRSEMREIARRLRLIASIIEKPGKHFR